MFVGQMGCEALNFLLKRLIKEERPKRTSSLARGALSIKRFLDEQSPNPQLLTFSEMNGKGYGMPSSHAQFTAYFSLYLALFLLVRHRPLPASPSHTPFTLWQRALLSVIALLGTVVVAWSRIYLNYHTPQQVLVGCGAGAFSAIAWFVVTETARRAELLDWVLETRLARESRMRDLVVEEDLVAPGWERWERKRMSRESNPYPTAVPSSEKKNR